LNKRVTIIRKTLIYQINDEENSAMGSSAQRIRSTQ